MTRQLSLSLLAAVAAALGASSAQAQILELFTEAEAGTNQPALNFLETVTSDGTTAYAVLRDSGAGSNLTDVGGVEAFDGSSFTTVSTIADFQATGSTNDLALGNGVGVVGGVLRGVSFFDNNVYEVDLGTGAVTEVVSKATIDAAAGVSANIGAQNKVAADGTIYALESVGDQILAISPGNVVTVEIDPTDFAAVNGGTSLGSIGILGDTLLLGSNNNDALIAWDTVNDTASTVLTTAQIDNATDEVDGVVGFGDIFPAPDGLVYFYESDADALMSYDPADPAGTIATVITEAEFTAGPSSDTINQLSWFDGRIAFTDGGIGYYTLIPEPTTGLLAALALAGFAARRR